ncbi:hypothetical protein J1N35_024544 [Gossypium stocksii]|uniref:DUF4283 domain-containing protein n=1 Tax=Gossypium stocksii TaxID=47602 RepID=A0A9D3V5T3_9ROSI|nr:hypothetical protein J1N35_024544 [Gossypium stocksii]
MENDLENLVLDADEEVPFQEEAGLIDQVYHLCLVGRCLMNIVVHFPSLRNTLADLWHPIKGICISDLREKRIQLGENPLLLPLNLSVFWVQIHDLPPRLMIEHMAKQFGDFIRRFIEYDTMANSFGAQSFMRLRFCLDVNVPLKRKKKIQIGADRVAYARSSQLASVKASSNWPNSVDGVVDAVGVGIKPMDL